MKRSKSSYTPQHAAESSYQMKAASLESWEYHSARRAKHCLSVPPKQPRDRSRTHQPHAQAASHARGSTRTGLPQSATHQTKTQEPPRRGGWRQSKRRARRRGLLSLPTAGIITCTQLLHPRCCQPHSCQRR